MASNPLNLYATKVFAEHPNVLWTLDEKVGYISLLDADYNNLANWNALGATNISVESMDIRPPHGPLAEQTPISAFEETDGAGQISFSSGADVESAQLNLNAKTITLGFYLFTPDRSVDVIIGYEVKDSLDQVIKTIRVQNLDTGDDNVEIPGTYVTPLSERGWAYVSATLPLPKVEFSSISPILDLSYSTSPVNYQFAVHAVTLGQWAEEFQSTSLGSTPVDLPADISSLGKGIPTQPYGLQGEVGYYLLDNNIMCAKNTGVPLAYGSANSTVITPNTNGPSLVLPVTGFLNFGPNLNQPLTYEFWANIQSNAKQERKIFGPVGFDAGLYVDRHLLVMKIDGKSGSYNVGQWARPMLIDIVIGRDSVSVLVNGEQVIYIQLDVNSLELISATADWVGFYAYEDVPIVSLEAFAIYPYEVPAVVQKRRFVYGQGVEEPTAIRGLNHSSMMATNHSNAGYSKSVSYPQTSSWKSGTSENIVTGKNSISVPDYGLPTLFLNKNKATWKTDSPSFQIKKTDEEGYFYFSNLSFLAENIESLFMRFSGGQANEVLFILENPTNGYAIKVSLTEDSVLYEKRLGANESFEQFGETSNNQVAGFNLSAVSQSNPDLSVILDNIQFCRVYLGGQASYSNSYSGTIESFALCSTRNSLQLPEEAFDSSGLAISISDQHLATYMLVDKTVNNTFELDVATQSVWEDYVPLSYFATYKKDKDDNPFLALDFLQLNIDFPRLESFDGQYYDTDGLPVKTYVSFQFLKDGSNKALESFSNTAPLPKGRVVDPGDAWMDTAFEVVDDSLIKIPVGFDIKNLSIVFHIHINSQKSISDKIRIRGLHFSSVALGTSPNKFKTKFGTNLLPYKKVGNVFEYKNVSPFSIGRADTPYLYLSNNSGVRTTAPTQGPIFANSEGISIPIVPGEDSTFFSIDMIQMFVRYENKQFSTTSPEKLFEIKMDGDPIEFYAFSDDPDEDSDRGQMYAIQGNRLLNNIMYYIDGKPVRRPILNKNIWTVISMSFTTPLSLSRGSVGAIRLNSPATRLENLSYYQVRQEDEIDRFAYRKWSAVRNGIDTTYIWDDWRDSTWQEVLYLVIASLEITNPESVYGTFMGTNSVIFDSTSSLVINNYQHSVYKNAEWSTYTITPA